MIGLNTLRKSKGYILAIVNKETGEYEPLHGDDTPQWIPVTVAMPSDGHNVLICTADGNVGEGEYSMATKSWTQYRWNVRNCDVVAWMPLPDKYERKEE